MGREQPTITLRPNQNRRDERARRARDTKNKTIPDLLRSCPRAKHGIAKAELIVDPDPVVEASQDGADGMIRPDLNIRVKALDTLTAASRMSEKVWASRTAAPTSRNRPQKPNVAILNMASALRPGGGFLDGANSQEEFLCARTTVYPSLWDSFYRLPEVSGIYTPDVLVFRDHLPDAKDLPKNHRYFVDVISSSMIRFADAKGEGCSCGVSYCDKHRDLVVRKMKAVLRIAQSKGVEKLILGAWGCGAYGNPVKEIAKCWRKVIAGAPRQRRPNIERWEGIKEIIFAIPDRTMLTEFQAAFSDVLADDTVSPSEPDNQVNTGADSNEEQQHNSEVITKMAEIELQLDQTKNTRLKNTLRQMLEDLQRQLNQGANAHASKDEDLSVEDPEDEELDGFVASGFPLASDQEDESFYYNNFDDQDLSSDGLSNLARSEIYEFRPGAPGLDSHNSHDEESQDESLFQPLSRSPPPTFDPETGWYAGSMDGLTRFLRRTGNSGGCIDRESPRSPELVRPESSGVVGLDAEALHSYLSKYQGTDVHDY